MKLKRLITALFLLAIAALSLPIAAAQTAGTPAEICAASVPAADPANRTYSEAEQVLEPGVNYQAVFCTGAGPIYIDLYEDYAPVTVNSFVFLAQQGYYNNTTFHRVIQDFMAQGGDPEGTGSGGPGYQFKDEFVGLLYFDAPGILAMANANSPEQGIVGTNGSQFFITTAATPHLDYRHTIFGKVLEGQESVGSIELRDPAQASEPGTALQTVVIITDPTTVTTTYVAPEAATQEQVGAAFEQLATNMTEFLPPELVTIQIEGSGVFSTDEAVAMMPEDSREQWAEYFARHGHEYRAANVFDSAGCDLQSLPVISMGYRLDSFASSEAAAAALADETLATLTSAMGFTESSTPEEFNGAVMYSSDAAGCDVEAKQAVVYLQRGHFMATALVTIPADLPVGPEVVIQRLVALLYERLLADVIRPELG